MKASKAGAVKILSSSHVVWGLVLFAVLNIFLLGVRPLAKSDPEALPSAHTWVWWRTEEWLKERTVPEVVLLGSSLVMIPVCLEDADFRRCDLDASLHARSDYMEHSLIEALSLKSAGCFNFGLPGGMISDDYMVTRQLLSGARKPRIIVLGITLRDFIDNHMQAAAASDTFRYLRRFAPVDDLVSLSMPQIWDRLDFYAGKTNYLWGAKLDLQALSAMSLKNLAMPLARQIYAVPPLVTPLPQTGGIASKLKPEIEPGLFMVHPFDRHAWEDNRQEYRSRFRGMRQPMFSTQQIFLEKLLALAQSDHICLVVVNMPLMPENMECMPPGAYGRYLRFVQAEAKNYNFRFIDLNDGKSFDKTNFRDTAHMNASGGRKFIDAVVAAIKADAGLSRSLGGAPLEASLNGKPL